MEGTLRCWAPKAMHDKVVVVEDMPEPPVVGPNGEDHFVADYLPLDVHLVHLQ